MCSVGPLASDWVQEQECAHFTQVASTAGEYMLLCEKRIRSFICWPVFLGIERFAAGRTLSGSSPAGCKTLGVLDQSPLLPRASQPPPRVLKGVCYSGPGVLSSLWSHHWHPLRLLARGSGRLGSLRSVGAGGFSLLSILAVRYFKALYSLFSCKTRVIFVTDVVAYLVFTK